MITNEAIKMRRFTAGLRSSIHLKMCCASIRTYAELIDMSTLAEQDEKRVARACSQLGPRNRMEGPSSSFAGKRSCPNSPPRLAATPVPPARPAQACSYYKRAGHSELYCFTRMRDLDFTPPQRNSRPPQQALQISPLRAMESSQQFHRPPPPQVETGATVSLVSHATVKRLGLRLTPIIGVRIIAAARTISEATRMCCDYPIDLGGKVVLVDLISTKVFHYDVILDMDWLTPMKAEIDCETRIVKIYEGDEVPFMFPFQVSHQERILCYASLEEGYDGPSITDTPVVQDFWDIFKIIPRLPPRCEIDFTINLVSGTKPISLPTYRMPPYEMEELRFVIVFIDDILIYSKSREKHGEHLRAVFETLEKNQLFAQFRKCAFWKEDVKFLGHVVSKGGISMDLAKVAAVQD
ncbi:uncharacterized protein LOC131254354 [Magnolia sinica]|uniref:uncharacterized protein LOC131254354 n=1 Tax=Magnolia sinica TaxID=86752 RepID=UPI00265828C9|nr:uncharacterized protein LOC131254354 [Magnolia sinica]